MRLFYLLLILLISSSTVFAGETQWFVDVYGENFQHVDGASANPGVPSGIYLDRGFTGKVIYVRSEQHYELDQFRPSVTEKDNSGADSVSSSADSSVVDVERQDKTFLDTEFGPLVDTGLQYHTDGVFHGWYCANLYVTPLGGRVYRLRCNETMRHD